MDRRRYLIALGLFTVYGAVLFHRALFLNQAFFWHDVSIDGLPLRQATAEAVHDGHLPLWDGRIGNGFSVIGETQAGVFYPLHALYYVGLPQYRVQAILLLIHCVLAAFFTFLYCRLFGLRWVACATAGMIYAYSAWLVGHSMCIVHPEAAAWLPALVLCLERWLRSHDPRWLVGAAACFAMQGVISAVIVCFLSAVTTVVYLLVGALGPRSQEPGGRSPTRAAELGRCAVAAVAVLLGGALLAAVQFAPTGALVSASTRSHMTAERLRGLSMTPRDLAYLVHPYIFGSYAEGNYFGGTHQYEVCGFVGTIALLFGVVGAVLGRGRARAFAVVLVPFALWMALARQNPLYELLPRVPGFGWFRAPGRYTLLTSLGLAVLAAQGLHLVTESRRATRLAFALALVGALLCVAAPLALRAARAPVTRQLAAVVPEERRLGPEERHLGTEQKAAEKYRFLLARLSPTDPTYGLLLLSLVASAALCEAGLRRREGARWVPEVALGLTVVQLFAFGFHYNPTISTEYYDQTPKLVQLLDRQQGEAVLVDDAMDVMGSLPGNRGWITGDMSFYWKEREILRPNRQAMYGVRGAVADYQLVPRRNFALARLVAASLRGRADPETGLRVAAPLQVVEALGARILVTSSRRALTDLPMVLDLGPVVARMTPKPAPLAYFGQGIVGCSDEGTALRQLCAPSFDWRRPVVEVPPPDDPTLSLPPGLVQAQVLSYQDDHGHLRIRYRASGPAFLVVRDAENPHFRAFIDGKPTQIFTTNYLFRGVVVEPGEHTVEMIYNAWDLRLGGAISGVTLLGMLLVLALVSVRRRRRAGDVPPIPI